MMEKQQETQQGIEGTNNKGEMVVSTSGSSKSRILQAFSSKTKKHDTITKKMGIQSDVLENGIILAKATSKSKIPVLTNSETKIIKRHTSLQNLTGRKKEDSSESKYNKGYKLFRRIVGLQNMKPSPSANVSMEEIFIRDYSFDNNSEKEEAIPKCSLPTSYYTNINPFMDQNIGESMRQMIDLRNKLEESEIHVKDMVVKYIRDKNLEKDLVNIICGHSKLLLESERHALNLASDTWIQQSEIYKDQQKTLQDTLNSIVQQNRELLAENDTLIKKNERLSAKVVQLHEMPASAHRSTTLTSVRALEESGKHNDKLRIKLTLAMNQIDDLEGNLKKLQKKNCFLQQQLGSSNLQMQNNKSHFDRQKGDYELEHAKLLQEYHNNKVIIKDSIEAGDVLLEDLDGLKPQMKLLMKTINWDKFKRRGKSLTDLIHLSRSCINELFRELSAKQNEIALHEQETQKLTEVIGKHSQTITELQTEKDKLEQTIQADKDTAVNLKLLEEKNAQLQSSLSNSELTISTRNAELANTECSLRARGEEIKKLNAILGERKTTLGQLQAHVGKLTEEKNLLQVQIDGMAQVLAATGTGEIAKELANMQDKLMHLQEQFYSVSAEKTTLLKQIEASSAERETLIAYQKSCYKHLKVQQHAMENNEVNHTSTKEQLEREKQTVIALQTERVRHLEEKTILTAIYERLKSELTKVDQLEGVVSTMNKKASKLAVIAEFNKQLGEKLQTEVAERDMAIVQLQNDVKQLNDQQLQNTKEKMALCEELSQIFNVKEVLNSKLTAEQQRNAKLGEYKKEIENAASAQMKELHTRFDVERAAMKNLMRDVTAIKAERDMMTMANKELLEKFELVEKHTSLTATEIEKLHRGISERDTKISSIEKQLAQQIKKSQTQRTKFEEKIKYYKQYYATSKEMIATMTQENNQLKCSINYLQADVAKVRADLDESRACAVNMKKISAEKESEDGEIDSVVIDEIITENVMLKRKITEMTDSFQELALEYERATDDTAKFEAMLREKFASTRDSASSSLTETPNTGSNEQIARRDNEICTLQDKIRTLQHDCAESTENLMLLTKQRDAAIKDFNKVNEKLKQMTRNYEESQNDVAAFIKEIELLKQKCSSIEAIKAQNENQKKSMEELTSDYDIKIYTMNSELDSLTSQVNELTATLSSEVEERHKVEKAHKVLAMKLFQAVQLVIAEKLARKNSDNKAKELEGLKQKMETDNLEIAELLRVNKEQAKSYIKQIQDLNVEKENILELLRSIENKWKHAENSVQTLDKVVREKLPDNDTQYKFEDAEARIHYMKHQLDITNQDIISLQEKLALMESQYAIMEFQKFEALLRLHEVQGKVQMEELINEELRQDTQNTLALIERMHAEKSITPHVYSNLLAAVRTSSTPVSR